MRRARLAILAVVVGLICGASTCDNQDFSRRFVLEVPTDGDPAVRAYRQAYIGRLTLDFGLINTGEAEAAYELSVQAQTTGETDAEACEASTGIPRSLNASAFADDGQVDDPSAVPLLRTLDRPHQIELPEAADGDGFAGAIDLRVRRASTYRIYMGDADTQLELFADGIAIPTAGVQAELDTCDALAAASSYELDEGTFRIELASTLRDVLLLVEETCEAQRTVPATCAGAASDLHVREPVTLAPGAFLSGRVSSLDLGVGDQAVVALACSPASACAGELEMFFLVEQLECRTDNDCRARESCSVDAYCVPDAGSGCSTSAGRAGWPAAALAMLTLLAVRRRQ